VFALLVAVSGTLDPPGLAYSLLLFVPAGLYLVLVERTASWRSVLAWGVRAGALALVVSAAVLVQLVNASSSLSARLFGTESVEAIHKTTSWAESWRGLGFWVSYFPDGTGLLRQQHAGYFEDPLLILATFVPATIGLVVLGWSRWKPRVLMAAFVLVSLVLMVGPFPPEQPMPFGQLLLVLYDQFPILTALRTSYKAGAGLALGVGCLLAAGVAVTCNARRTTTGRAIPVVSALVLIGVVSVPFWTGMMYSSDDRMRQLPSYWSEALEWLDRRPDNTRALILPGTSNTRYRWGSPGDDIFDGLLRRSHMVYTSFPVSTPRAYDLERAIDEHVTSAEYMPGTLAPVARRLGLRYVVVRNDLDWQKIGRLRPAALQALRSDPDLELIAEFGDRGQNTVAPGDRSPAARSEARLHPVEVFRVKDVPEPVRGLSPTPPLLVAGDGNAWFRLAAQGLLNGRGPLRYTAESDDDALKGALAAGSEVVVTDTNRRQVTLLTRFGEMGSYTLAPGADVGREPRDLFQRAGSQSVAVFGDATKINAAGAEEGSGGFEAGSRPANAFDGDESTSWLTGAFEAPVGRSLQVTFDHPETISEVGVSVAGADDGREVIAASVRFPDGSRVPLDLVGGRSELRIPPRRTSSVEIRIDAVAGDGENAVGFSEITLGDLDLREFIQVPDDQFQAAERSPALARELERAPLRYLFERSQAGEGLVDAEQALRRRFRTAGARSYALSGTLVVDEETPDQVVDLLVGGPAGAATGDAGPGPCTRGIVRLDGDSVPVRRTGPFEELAGGVAVPFSGCDDVDIGPGWHELESGTGVSVDTVALATGQERALIRSPDQPRVAVTDSGRASYTLHVDAPDGGAVVSGLAYDSGWRAAIDGEDLGPPQPMDAQAAWRLPGPGSHTVEMRYQPQGVYDLALVMSGSGIALCLWLIGKGRRS
jgi:arabinofuranan 3-O-arabinosyltransferase